MMNINFWGTRGSVPVSGSDFVRHGGQTTCLSVEIGDQVCVIDLGTGAVKLGRELRTRRFHALQTHVHWDHIQGFPFFAPIFHPDVTIDFLSVERDGCSLEDALVNQMAQPTFPVPLDIAPASFIFQNIPTEGVREFQNFTLKWTEVHHPGGCTAFRFEADEGIFVFTADVEAPECRKTLVEFCRDADIVAMDAQYFPDEFKSRIGWGHSTYQHAVDVAREANVSSLYLTHHDPSHDDARLDDKVRQARRYANRDVSVDNAYDGLRLELSRASHVAA